jgi:hypothetical protein
VGEGESAAPNRAASTAPLVAAVGGNAAAERERLLQQVARLRFGAADMDQAAAAAEALLAERHNGSLCRALETAIAVCYARPFSESNRIGSVGNRWIPKDSAERRLHRRLIELRDQVYAHTDETDAREIIDVGALFGDESAFAEQWRPVDRTVLPRIVALCGSQQERFRKAAAELQARIVAMGEP